MDDKDRSLSTAPKDLEITVEVRVTGINSSFLLSDQADFQASLERFCVPAVGEFCVGNGHRPLSQLTVQYHGYKGRCVVYRNGLVKCSGQLSFDEARMVAAKVVWKFRTCCGQTVSIYKHRFHVVTSAAELPYCVSLNRLKLRAPEIMYLPEIRPPCAFIRLDELGGTISLYSTGKMVIFSSGDCEIGHDSMPNLSQAIQTVATLAGECLIPGSEKPADNMQSELPAPFTLRRSIRLAKTTQAKTANVAAGGTPASSKRQLPLLPTAGPTASRINHLRLFEFMSSFIDIFGFRSLVEAITGLTDQRLAPDTTKALVVATKYFSIKPTRAAGIQETLVIPLIKTEKKKTAARKTKK